MPNYTKIELQVGLESVLGEKRSWLMQTRNASLYLEELDRGLALLKADASGHVTADPPARLMEADRNHDARARFLRRHLESYRLDPDLDEVLAGRVERALEIVPTTRDPGRTVAEEVALGRAREARLPEYQEDLAAIPLIGGRSALDAYRAYLVSVENLDRVSRESASAVAAKPDRSEVSKLRTRLVSLLNQLRDAVEAEVARDLNLPRNLVAEAFSYFNELDRRRQQRAKPKAEEEPILD